MNSELRHTGIDGLVGG